LLAVLLGFFVLGSSAFAQAVLVQLLSENKPLQPAAVYDCSSITTELKCVSAVADDTAHLSENPKAQILPRNGKIFVRKKKLLGDEALAFYIAAERALLDDPKYNKLELLNNELDLPPSSERTVLIAIYKRPRQSRTTKLVWLFAPSANQKR
jgi:hypothetical protein